VKTMKNSVWRVIEAIAPDLEELNAALATQEGRIEAREMCPQRNSTPLLSLLAEDRYFDDPIALALIPFSNCAMADPNGMTPLILAAGQNRSSIVLRALLPLSDIKARDQQGRNALEMAISDGDSRAVRLLLPQSQPALPDARNRTPLMLAAHRATVEVLTLLLPLNDACAFDDLGRTALMHAASSLLLGNIEALIPFSDLHAQDHKGRTALMHAAATAPDPFHDLFSTEPPTAANNPNFLAVRALVAGSDMAKTDRDGLTAFEIAAAAHNFHAADFMAPNVEPWRWTRALKLAGQALGGLPENAMPRTRALLEGAAIHSSLSNEAGANPAKRTASAAPIRLARKL